MIVLAFDILHQYQAQLQQGYQFFTEDPREYWKVITKQLDNVCMIESEDLRGLSIVLQRNLRPYACLVQGCNDDSDA